MILERALESREQARRKRWKTLSVSPKPRPCCRADQTSDARTGFGETDGVFRRFLRARSRDPGLAQGSKGEGREAGRSNASTTNQPTNERPASSSVPFVARGSALRSALRSAPFLVPPPFAAFPEKSRRGAFLLPGRVTPRIHQSEKAAPPLPLLTKHDDDSDEDSRGRNSGGSFRREIQAGEIRGEMSFRAFAAATPLLSPVPRRSWPRGARVEWRVAKMVVVLLLKVASWCEWRDC